VVTTLPELSGLEVAAVVRRREASPVEVVEAALARLEALDPRVGAFTTITAEAALDRARALESAVLRGDPLPPLAGVPTAIKDLNTTAGVRTTFGSVAYRDFVPPVDDAVVAMVAASGAVSLGKTTTPEFGLPCYTEPDVAPPARTPWDLTRSAGGSSGGAGAAVAAGIVPLAQGSDGGGSIRIPASVCGLVGLKPSRGRVSTGPVAGDVTGLGTSGPLARTVRDAAALLDALSVPEYGDPWPAPAPPPEGSFLAACEREPGRLRIGRYATPVLAGTDVHPSCVAAWESASALLACLGHEVEDVPPPDLPDALPLFMTLWSVSAAGTPVARGDEEALRPLTRWLRGLGRQRSGPEFVAALAALQRLSRAAVRATAPYDAVLTPTLAQPPAPVGGLRDDADPAADFAAQTRFTPFTSVANVTGQPAISLPLSWDAAGLPIGVMLVGRCGGEGTLLRLAAQMEAARPWAHRRPPVW
jgi:amidase